MQSVYFVSDGEFIKIGKAVSVPIRLKALQCGSPRKLTLLGTRNDVEEYEVHALFSKFRVRGEWFRYCVEIVDFAKGGTQAPTRNVLTEEELDDARVVMERMWAAGA